MGANVRAEKGYSTVARTPDPLSNTGLSERLEQHARRGGAALGVMMALCMVIGIAGFIYLYNRLDFFPDARTRATDIAAGGVIGAAGSASAVVRLTPAATRPAGTPGANATSVAGATVATATATAAQPATAASGTPGTTMTPGLSPTPAFSANYRIVGGQPIVFRADATRSSASLKSLPPGTELQFLGQSQEVGPDKWLRMRDQSGTEGWVREIDAERTPG